METIVQELERHEIEQQCRAAVQALLAKRSWRLLEPEEFAIRTARHLGAGRATNATRAAMYTYSLAMYAACSGEQGAEPQNLGYTELFQYLYDIACRRYPSFAVEAAQQAIEAVFATFQNCRQPGAFLAFCCLHLLDAARALRRQQNSPHQSLSTPVGSGDTTLGDLLPDPRQNDPVVATLADEQRARCVTCAADFLRKHPRAAQQFSALWMKYIDGLDDLTISRKLGKPLNSVYVLRSRAIEKLQSDPDWRDLARECGLLLCCP